MTYKISLKMNMSIRYYSIKNILRHYKHLIKDCAICNITTPDNTKIKYLDVYLHNIMNIEDFFNICIDLSILRYSISDNIKLKNVETNEIIYSLNPYYNDVKKEGKIKREYSKIYL